MKHFGKIYMLILWSVSKVTINFNVDLIVSFYHHNPGIKFTLKFIPSLETGNEFYTKPKAIASYGRTTA